MRTELYMLIVLCHVGVSSHPPDCQDNKDVVFIAEPSNIEVSIAAHTSAQFSCQYHNIIQEGEVTIDLEWIINSKSYCLTELPANHIFYDNGNILYVTNITGKDNDTSYQCQILTRGAEQYPCVYKSSIGKLIINDNDSVNNFIQISFNKAMSSINCTFVNQPKNSEKYCIVKYGTVTAIPRCRLLVQVKGHVYNSNSISLHLNLEDATTVCYNIEAGNNTKTVRIGGSFTFAPEASKKNMPMYIATFVSAVVTTLSILVAIVIVVCLATQHRSHQHPKDYNIEKEPCMENTSRTQPCEDSPMDTLIDKTTSFFTIHIVTECCYMYKVTTDCYSDHQPQDGFGYYQLTNEEIMSISPHKRVIIMEEDNPSLPKLITTGGRIGKYITKRQNPLNVYAQDKSYTKVLTAGSRILCYFPSEVVIAYTKSYDVTKSCNSKSIIPYHKPEWTRYGYFEFTKPEYIRPDQRVIVMKQDGTLSLVTGPGIRHLLGIIGDGSTITMPPQPSDTFGDHEFKHVFIQSRESGRELEPGTKYLFCAMMDKVREYHAIYDVEDDCSMIKFGSNHIPGFRIKEGYGYYEFTKPEFIKPHRNVILMDKHKRLFTGAGARFFYTGCEYDMDAVLRIKRVPPPNLDGTQWAHIFVQSHSTKRILKQGTIFLYCEHKS